MTSTATSTAATITGIDVIDIDWSNFVLYYPDQVYGSIVNVDSTPDQTLIGIYCQPSVTCSSILLPVTITTGPSTFAAQLQSTTGTVQYTIWNTCEISSSTAASCSASMIEVISSTLTSTRIDATTTVSGSAMSFVTLIVTGGLDKISSTTPTTSTRSSTSTTSTISTTSITSTTLTTNPTGATNTSTSSSSQSTSQSSHSSSSWIAGPVVGAVAGCVILGILAMLWRRKRRRPNSTSSEPTVPVHQYPEPYNKAELPAESVQHKPAIDTERPFSAELPA